MADYRELRPDLKYVDVSQYPRNGRARGECKDGSLCTLTTSTKLYCQETLIFMLH